MTRFSGIGGGFSGYSAISRSFAITGGGGGSEYSGSTMLFVQASAPTGWVQVTTYNDYALRVTSGTAGSGGSVNFSSVFTTITPTGTTSTATLGAATDATAITSGTLPGHTHTYASNGPYLTGYNVAPTVNRSPIPNNSTSSDVVSPSVGQTHIHPAGNTIHTTFSGTPLSMSVKYIDCILATRS
jgi:hypothetical protein